MRRGLTIALYNYRAQQFTLRKELMFRKDITQNKGQGTWLYLLFVERVWQSIHSFITKATHFKLAQKGACTCCLFACANRQHVHAPFCANLKITRKWKWTNTRILFSKGAASFKGGGGGGEDSCLTAPSPCVACQILSRAGCVYVYRSVARVSLLKTSSVECQAPGYWMKLALYASILYRAYY